MPVGWISRGALGLMLLLASLAVWGGASREVEARPVRGEATATSTPRRTPTSRQAEATPTSSATARTAATATPTKVPTAKGTWTATGAPTAKATATASPTPDEPSEGQEDQQSGVLTVVWGDPLKGRRVGHRQELYLTNSRGRTSRVEVESDLAEKHGGTLELNGQEVTIEGTWAGSGEAVQAAGAEQKTLKATAIKPSSRTKPPATSTGVASKWATLLCKFPDTASSPPSRSWFQGLVGGSGSKMDAYWREISYGKMNLTGSVVVGWKTMPQPRAFYGIGGAVNHAKLFADCAATFDAEVNFPSFYGVNLVFDTDLGGVWGGSLPLAIDGQTKTYGITYIPEWAYSVYYFGHEMGHGLGLPHSSGDYGFAYDSYWDVMSAGGLCGKPDPTYGCEGVHTIGYHKDRLGWLASSWKYLAAAGSDLTVTLMPLDLATTKSGQYSLAQVPIGGSSTSFYTVELRRLQSYDDEVPALAVVIHKVDTTRRVRPARVVDADGNGDPNDAGGVWIVGETFNGATAGITIKVTGLTSSQAKVQVTLARLPSDRAPKY